MTSHQKKSTKRFSVPAPYVKSPLQLKYLAAFEALTAERSTEAAAKKQTDESAANLIARSDGWSKAEIVRSFVALVASKVPADADEVTRGNASKWQEWALGIADSIDPTSAQLHEFFVKANQSKP